MEIAPIRLFGSANSSGMNSEFQTRLANLLSAAPEAYRANLGIYSGFRDQAKQDRLFAAAVKKYGSEGAARKWVAKKSEHTAGFAADVGWNGGSLKGAPPAAIKWLHDNAASYGLHFPLSNENWHIEPVEVRAGGRPVYDVKLKSYPGLSPIAGHPVPSADIPDGAPQPMLRPASLSVPSAAGLLSPAAVQPASFGTRGGTKLDMMNPGADGQAFFDPPTMAMLRPSDQMGRPTVGTPGDGVGAGNLLDLRTAGMLTPRLPAANDYGQPPVTLAQTRAEQAQARIVPRLPVTTPPIVNRTLSDIHDARDAGTMNAQTSAPRLPAPVPMTGRPAALNAPPQVAPTPMPSLPRVTQASAEVAPPPRQRPTSFGSLSAPTEAATPLLRLPSGKMVEAGLMPSSDGQHVLQITDDGKGNAKVTKLSNPGEIPGVLDPLRSANSNTVAGGIIRAQLPKIMADGAGAASSNMGYAADSLKSSALDAATGLGKAVAASGVGNIVGNIGSAFGSMFGGDAPVAGAPKLPPAQTSWSPWGASVMKPTVPAAADLGYSPAVAPAPAPAYRQPVVSNAPKPRLPEKANPLQTWFQHTPIGAAMTPPSLMQLPVLGANASNPLARAFGQTPAGRLISMITGSGSLVGPALPRVSAPAINLNTVSPDSPAAGLLSKNGGGLGEGAQVSFRPGTEQRWLTGY
jgi:hypothetical protein